MLLSSFVAIALGVIGTGIAYQAISDVVNGIGIYAEKKWKTFIQQLSKIVNENSQLLSDFKSKNENEKAYIVNSLITSSGLGPRAQSLRKEFQNKIKQDKELTDEVTQKNAAASAAITDAETKASDARSGLIGASIATHTEPDDTSKFKVNDPNQNIQGGLEN